MQRPEGQVKDFLEGIDHEIRRRDAMTLVDLMESATGEEPRVWESILGFGQYDYRYESGREGTAPAAGFSPRNAATTIYLVDGVGDTTISFRTWAARHRCRLHLCHRPGIRRSRYPQQGGVEII